MARKSTIVREPDIPPAEDLLDGPAAMKLLGVGRCTLIKLRQKHGLPYFQWDGIIRYSRREIAKWLATQSEYGG